MTEYKDKDIDIDIVTIIKDIFVAVIENINKQKGQNIVLTNGNNNEVQCTSMMKPGKALWVFSGFPYIL